MAHPVLPQGHHRTQQWNARLQIPLLAGESRCLPRGCLKANTSGHPPQVLFVAGLGGTGHHLWSTILQRCRDQGKCRDVAGARVALARLGRLGRLPDWRLDPGGGVNPVASAFTALDATWAATNVLWCANALTSRDSVGLTGMLSYPNGNKWAFPDLTQLATIARDVGVRVRVLVLLREPLATVEATYHRGVHAWGNQSLNWELAHGPTDSPVVAGLAASAHELVSQLSRLQRREFACVRFEELESAAVVADELAKPLETNFTALARDVFIEGGIASLHRVDMSQKAPGVSSSALERLKQAHNELEAVCFRGHVPLPRRGSGSPAAPRPPMPPARQLSKGEDRARWLANCAGATIAGGPHWAPNAFSGWAAPFLWATAPGSAGGPRALMLPKAGSSSLRLAMSRAYGLKGDDGAPWRMGGGSTPPSDSFSSELPAPLAERSFAFTFVQEPATHFISGLHVSSVHGGSCTETSAHEMLLRFLAGEPDLNVHLAPQMWLVSNAAEQFARAIATPRARLGLVADTTNQSLLHFVGHLGSVQSDWADLRRLMNASGLAPLPAEMPHERNQGEVDPGEYKKRSGLKRRVCHREQLGRFARLETWPRDLATRLCERLRPDYICLGFALPDVCLRKAVPAGLTPSQAAMTPFNPSSAFLQAQRDEVVLARPHRWATAPSAADTESGAGLPRSENELRTACKSGDGRGGGRGGEL